MVLKIQVRHIGRELPGTATQRSFIEVFHLSEADLPFNGLPSLEEIKTSECCQRLLPLRPSYNLWCDGGKPRPQVL